MKVTVIKTFTDKWGFERNPGEILSVSEIMAARLIRDCVARLRDETPWTETKADQPKPTPKPEPKPKPEPEPDDEPDDEPVGIAV
jgi:hypothetical protein